MKSSTTGLQTPDVNDNTRRFFAIRKKEQPESRIIVKVSIFGDMHEALVDTGASHSFIDSSIVSHYNLKVTKATGFIELADKSVIPRIGETDHIEIEHCICTLRGD